MPTCVAPLGVTNWADPSRPDEAVPEPPRLDDTTVSKSTLVDLAEDTGTKTGLTSLDRMIRDTLTAALLVTIVRLRRL